MHNSQHHMCAAGALFMYLTCMNVCAIYIHTYMFYLYKNPNNTQRHSLRHLLISSPQRSTLKLLANTKEDTTPIFCVPSMIHKHTHTTETTIHTCSMLNAFMPPKMRRLWRQRERVLALQTPRESERICRKRVRNVLHTQLAWMHTYEFCSGAVCFCVLFAWTFTFMRKMHQQQQGQTKPNIAQTQSASTIRVQHIIPFLTYIYREQYVNSKTCFGQANALRRISKHDHTYL